jgi:hypothetical protein
MATLVKNGQLVGMLTEESKERSKHIKNSLKLYNLFVVETIISKLAKTILRKRVNLNSHNYVNFKTYLNDRKGGTVNKQNAQKRHLHGGGTSTQV